MHGPDPSYPDTGSTARRSTGFQGLAMQSAQPRDVGVLILVIGLFLILFVVTLLLGTPVR